MNLGNSRTGYGWAAIALHWISGGGVLALYLLGERMEEASGRTAKLAAQDLHVSVGVLLFTFLAARAAVERVAAEAEAPGAQPLVSAGGGDGANLVSPDDRSSARHRAVGDLVGGAGH
jgi:cytochrome b561